MILVLSHPKQGEAWWADVKAAFPDAESRASRTIVVRKQASSFDAGAAPALLRLGVPAASGLYLKPPPVTEVLTTNLLPVVSMPPTIHLARAAGQKGPEPGWMLRDDLVMPFASLREPPLRALCAGDQEEHSTAEWADSKDTDIQRRFTDLLACTVERSYPDLRWHDARRHVHFRASSDLKPRKAGTARTASCLPPWTPTGASTAHCPHASSCTRRPPTPAPRSTDSRARPTSGPSIQLR